MTRHYWQTADGGEYDSMALWGESDPECGSVWASTIGAATAADWQGKIAAMEERISETEALADRYGEWMRKTNKPTSFAAWRVRLESLLSLVQDVQP